MTIRLHALSGVAAMEDPISTDDIERDVTQALNASASLKEAMEHTSLTATETLLPGQTPPAPAQDFSNQPIVRPPFIKGG